MQSTNIASTGDEIVLGSWQHASLSFLPAAGNSINKWWVSIGIKPLEVDNEKEADLCDGVIPRSWEIKSDWQVGAIPKNDRLYGLSKRKNIRNSLDLESLN